MISMTCIKAREILYLASEKRERSRARKMGGNVGKLCLRSAGWGYHSVSPNTGIISTQNTEPTGSGLGRDGKVIGA